MVHIPFDSRVVHYNHFGGIVQKEGDDGPPSEPYQYFDRLPRQEFGGFSNIQQRKGRKYSKFLLPEIADETSEPLKNNQDGESTAKGIGVLIEPAPEENKIKPIHLASRQTLNIHIKKKAQRSGYKGKDKPNQKLTSIVGRAAFKPSLILTSDKKKPSIKNKRSRKDIFGSY
jgi:hypothetical protein